MADLHAQLRAAVLARMELAKAAAPGPWTLFDANEDTEYSPFWIAANDAFHNPPFHNPPDEDTPWIAVEIHIGGREDGEHIAANGPDVTIRMCERDLAVLERHALTVVRTNIDPAMPACAYSWGDGDGWVQPYPCGDVRDLARAYGIDVAG